MMSCTRAACVLLVDRNPAPAASFVRGNAALHVESLPRNVLGWPGCLFRFMTIQRQAAVLYKIEPSIMLTRLPTAVVPQLPQCICRGAIPTWHPLLSMRNLSFRSRQLQVLTPAASIGDTSESGSSPSEPALRSIRGALQDGRHPVACQGSAQPSSPVRVYGMGYGGQFVGAQLPPSNEAALQPLLNAAVPTAGGLSAEPNEVRQRPAGGCRLVAR
jgi:hypothetical protein